MSVMHAFVLFLNETLQAKNWLILRRIEAGFMFLLKESAVRHAPSSTESHAKDGTAVHLTSQCEFGKKLKDATCRKNNPHREVVIIDNGRHC